MNSEELGSACGAVVSCKSQVARSVALGDVIGYWSLVIGGRASALHAGLKSRFQKTALQRNAPKFSILNSQFSIKNLPTTHYPLPTKFGVVR